MIVMTMTMVMETYPQCRYCIVNSNAGVDEVRNFQEAWTTMHRKVGPPLHNAASPALRLLLDRAADTRASRTGYSVQYSLSRTNTEYTVYIQIEIYMQ